MAGFDTVYHEFLQKPSILLKDLYRLVAHPEQVRAYLQKTGLLGDFGGACPQPNCTGTVSFCKDGGNRQNWRCSKRGCRYKVETRAGSFFQGSHLDYGDILLLIYFFVHKLPNEFALKQIGLSEHTVVDWYQFCRDICCEILLLDNRKIGGKNFHTFYM